MKKITLLLALAFAFCAKAQVQFVKPSSLEELFARAKTENKLVFIDAYTDWCGWCKVLDKNVFPTQAIGDIMNKHFIATRLEFEQDSLGILLARKYATALYPTALILNGDGERVYLIEGYYEPAVYAQKLLDATDPTKQIRERGFSGSFRIRYPAFYLDAFPMKGTKKKMADSATVNNYLAAQQDLSTEQNWVVLKTYYYRLNETLYQRVMNEEHLLSRKFGSQEYESLLENMISMKMSGCKKTKDFEGYTKYLLMLETRTANGKKNRHLYIEDFMSSNQQWKPLVANVKNSLKDSAYAADHSHMNNLCWNLYEKCEDREALESATGWMAAVVKDEPIYMYLDTYAALLYKTKQIAEARKYAEEAIATGKRSGEEVKETEALLKKINGVK